ncbi:MAG TPA: hypothetical protein DIW64_05435 [Cellvibrio sp.]|nr:hypothetical protein [Cellvibrio sp.]
MTNFIIQNNLYLMTALAVFVAIFTAVKWPAMPVLQRLVALLFIGVVLHLWEEGRFPGGFTDLITNKLGFTASNPHFGEIITAAYVLGITFIPLFFPRIIFLAMAPMMLGILEAIVHVAAIWMFELEIFYSPGMVTAVFVMMPVSIYGITYAVRQYRIPAHVWLISFLYMFGVLMLSQQIVVRASGMEYSEFLRNVHTAIFNGEK